MDKATAEFSGRAAQGYNLVQEAWGMHYLLSDDPIFY